LDLVYMASELEFLQFSSKIDHSVLNPSYTDDEAIEEVKVSAWYRTKYAIVKPHHLPITKTVPGGNIISTIGFPHGGNSMRSKIIEAQYLHTFMCKEADMVMNIGAFRSKKFKYVEDEIIAVKNGLNNIINTAPGVTLPSGDSRSHNGSGSVLKVIIEVGHLTDDEIADACKLVEQAGGDFVKTSSGYGPRGATLKDIEIMKNSVSSAVGVKAAGGIRTLESALAMIDAGADRLGLTATKKICDDWRIMHGLIDLSWDNPDYKDHKVTDAMLNQL
jgi:deoxyribose-phosphate aldolase